VKLLGVTSWRALLSVAVLSLAANGAQARIVAIDLDLPIDQVAAGSPIKVGDHHHARIFYDTDKVDRKTHRVKPLHMQHLVAGQWIPERLDPITMSMDDSWLDLGTSPYAYHYHSSMGGGSTVDFDETARRMTIRRADGSVVVAAPYIVDPTPVADPALFTLTAPPPKFTMYNVEIHLDQVGNGGSGTLKIGDIDKVRVIYDASLVDPRTHRAHLVNFQHYVRDSYLPAHVDSVAMPVRDAWIDLSRQPYRVHLHAAVTHGMPILIDADENTGRLSVRPQADPSQVLLAGPYSVDSTPISGPEVDAAASPAPRQPPTPAAAAPTPPNGG
jgi:hypothetical protein